MTATTIPTGAPVAPTLRAATAPRHGRGWAWAGVAAGVAGIGMIVTSGAVVATEDALADNAVVLQEVIDKEAFVWAFQVLCSAAALGVAVFAAGLRRKLAAQAPADSLLPTLAASGLAAVALMLLVGGGISTELFFSLLQDYGKADPDTVGAHLAIFNTMAYVWAGIGLTAGSVAVAAIRHGSLPRWLGWFSAVVTVLVALVQIVPLQYMAAFAGAPWLIVAGIGLARADRD
ncbi:MAG: hypothetical protein ACO1PW_04850 [Actinomycetota bacterium]